ncbi:MAG: VanZ family protein [Armatimonadetes bacterium]|nr:VanZ family protein [Armatimonadota bacterium]
MNSRAADRAWVPTLLWALVIFVTSSTVVTSKRFVKAVATSAPVVVTEDQFAAFWNSWWWLFVKGWHVLEYFVLAFFLAKWLIESARPKAASLATVAVLSLAYAATDEFHQTFVPMRGGRVSDWLIDATGVALALACIILFGARRTSNKAIQGTG